MHGLVISALKMGTLNTLLSIMQMAAGMMIKYQGPGKQNETVSASDCTLGSKTKEAEGAVTKATSIAITLLKVCTVCYYIFD